MQLFYRNKCLIGTAINPLYRQRKDIMKKYLFTFLIFCALSLTSQAQVSGTDYDLYLSGQVTNIDNGAPVPNQVIYIESDMQYNPVFIYYDTVITDQFGFYYDTINTNIEKGSLVFTTYDIDNEQYKQQQYFRFYWSNSYNLITDFAIYDTATYNDFQANFFTVRDTAYPNKLYYQFFDDSYGDDIVYWAWDFGDSTISFERNPLHLYEKSGIYEVSLTISNKICHNEYFYISTITKRIKAGMYEYYHFGGHAFANDFPIDLGTAYLFKYDSSSMLIPFDTATIDTLGYYYFYQLLEGDYVTKILLDPGSAHYYHFVPTYYGNVLTWDEAKIINLTATGWEYDIHMIQQNEIPMGDGLIQGNISYGGDSKPGNPPADGIEILLLNHIDDCITFMYSDQDGNFEFNDLPYDTYTVYAEIPGKQTYPAVVTIDVNNPAVNNLALIILSNAITFSIGEIQSDYVKGIGDIYPNPSRDKIYLDIEMTKPSCVRCGIFNQTGQLVYDRSEDISTGTHRIMLNVQALAEGVYTVQITTQDNVRIVKKLMRVN